MKRITLLVPDQMIQLVGKSAWSQRSDVEVAVRHLVFALEHDDYHDRTRFPEGSVVVVAIEDHPAQAPDGFDLIVQQLELSGQNGFSDAGELRALAHPKFNLHPAEPVAEINWGRVVPVEIQTTDVEAAVAALARGGFRARVQATRGRWTGELQQAEGAGHGEFVLAGLLPVWAILALVGSESVLRIGPSSMAATAEGVRDA